MTIAVADAVARRPSVRSRAGTRSVGLLAAIVLLAAVTACSLAYGAKAMPLQTVWDAFTDFDPQNNDHLIVRSLRVPRTIIGLLVGAALGLAGAVMQGVTRNPLADPALLGIEAGASLAVVAGISVFNIGSLSGYVWFAFAGAAGASAVVYGLSSFGHRGSTPLKLALAGTAVAALLSSLTSAVLLLDVTTLDQFRFWVVGSLAGRDDAIIWDVIPFIAVGAVLSVGVGSGLNTLALGDDIARGLGQRVAVIRAVSAVAVVLLCGAATAAAGPIAFVGLTVPHVARAICGPDYRWILPWSMVLAPTLLLGADVIGRLVARPGELQVGIVTAIIGAPFFIALVRRRHLVEL
ncbi:MAG TPA: iron chelate uptake ABC transporter family permease subunit [Desertimonas sp.]|nr:iron chelate uptake ABC transporter family permease subunit [Desertimonas sp.]